MSFFAGCCFGLRFVCCVSNFIVLCIIWSNLDSIKEDYDKILDSYSNDVSFYVLSSDDFWGPVTVLCDETSWNFNYDINLTNETTDETTDDTSYCKEFVNQHFDKLDTTQEYFSLYWLTPREERKTINR